MTLIAVLLAMATERYWHPLSSYKLFSPLLSWRDVLLNHCGRKAWFNGAIGVLLVVTPAVLIMALLQVGLASGDGFLLQVLGLALSLLVLVACVGDQRFGTQVRRYMQSVSAGDFTAASIYLNELSAQDCHAENMRQLNRSFLALLLTRLNERVLALLFWFVVLGPMGAVLYRSVTQLQPQSAATQTDNDVVDGVEPAEESLGDRSQSDVCQSDGFSDSVRRLKGIMDWLPVRLTALCYAMIGSFTDVMGLWRTDRQGEDDDWVASNDRLLLDVGIGSLQLQSVYVDGGADSADDLDAKSGCEHVLAVRALCKRTLMAWVVILALMTLAGWLG